MGIEVELRKMVQASPKSVWSLLASPKAWSTWWPECESASTLDSKALREGSQLRVAIKPGNNLMELEPEVDLFTDERTLSFTHRSALLQCTCVFYLHEKPTGTLVVVQAVSEGLQSFVAKIMGRGHLVQVVLESGLRGLKRLAERME